MKTATIIICTRNREAHLRETLHSIGKLTIPNGIEVSLLVIDNASTDGTAEVIRTCGVTNMPMTSLLETRPGLVHARNLGLRTARGDYLLWTDDDVRIPVDWVSRMTQPLLAGTADAVSGRIRMARSLERPWMQRTHYFRLADNRFRGSTDLSLVGANMAFSRRVLEAVPQFDSELGPGGLGQRDDTLFSQQVSQAGFRICQVECEAEHYFEEKRLLRRAWLRHGEASGQSAALIRVHWEHSPIRMALPRLWFWQAARVAYRVLHPGEGLEKEGCGRGEIRIAEQIAYYTYYLQIKDAPPKYERFGLRPLAVS